MKEKVGKLFSVWGGKRCTLHRIYWMYVLCYIGKTFLTNLNIYFLFTQEVLFLTKSWLMNILLLKVIACAHCEVVLICIFDWIWNSYSKRGWRNGEYVSISLFCIIQEIIKWKYRSTSTHWIEKKVSDSGYGNYVRWRY